MPERDVAVGPEALEDSECRQLMGRIGIGVEEVDDDRLATGREQASSRLLHLRLIERNEDASCVIHALADAEPELARDQRLEAAGHAVGVRPGAPAKFQHITKACGRDEASAGELALQERIRRGGGAVDHRADRRRISLSLGECREHTLRLVGGRGRHLGDAQRGGRGCGVEEQEVREGAAHIDADDLRPSGHRTAPGP
jgi:hypothetical protein